jgi:hypothetical protein
MARGQSGRIVLEIDPTIKRAIHARLVAEGRSLKGWFLERVEEYLDPRQQVLPLGEYVVKEPPVMQVAEPRKPGYVTRRSQ